MAVGFGNCGDELLNGFSVWEHLGGGHHRGVRCPTPWRAEPRRTDLLSEVRGVARLIAAPSGGISTYRFLKLSQEDLLDVLLV